MKSLKDVQKFETVFLISSFKSEYDITPVVYTDSYYKDDCCVMCVSDGNDVYELCVSKERFDEGDNTEVILVAPKEFANHYLICADEEVAIDNQERLYRDDIREARELIKTVNKKLNRLRRERNGLKKKNYGTQ